MITGYLLPDEFKRVYSIVPRLCADLIIKMHGGIILTLRNLPQWENHWHLPGGTIYYKETIEQAVARISQNELNISVEMIRPLGYIEYPSEEKERGFGWSVSIPIVCVSNSREFKVGEDASEARVFTELPDTIIPEQKTFLSSHWVDIISGM
jgi:ADP-ribose pyrophosphatase YjhB (NUDIX family)